MKRIAIVSGICASLLLGAALLAAAQDEHKNEKQGAPPAVPQERQEKPQDQARPMERQNQNQQPQNMERPNENRQGQEKQNQQNQDRQRQDQQNVERQRQDQQNQERRGEVRPKENQQNNGHERSEGNRQDQARPEGQPRGQEHAREERREAERRRIPDNDFREHFGREHRFAPGRVQIFEGRPRFFYSGYTFELLDPWPMDWSYDEDDCYVDYIDDSYWLFNYRHPGERVAVIILG
jgi:hypothetical protein